MLRSISIVMFGLVVASGCGKKADNGTGAPAKDPPGSTAGVTTPPPAPGAKAPAGDPAAVKTSAGVEAGGIQRDADEGPAAVVTAVTGTVEVRRVGETDFAAAKADLALFPGDVIRTGETSSATIALADESVVEIAEVSTVAVASRAGTADPASAAAVLSGLARFTVTARAPGEGAFRVYTPAGVILTRGTTYGVGVAASGEAMVGVESGMVDIIGLASLDAQPVVVEAGSSIVLEADGKVAAPAPWPKDDWGTWRDEADAKLELAASFDAHADALTALDVQLVDAYAELDASAATVASFEASAAASADAGETATYEASLPDGAATIDASFAVAGRLELLTWAYASHATLASDLYVRHPVEVEAQWQVVAPQIDAAVLWPKRYEITAVGYLEPLRVQYYVHHPRGRVHAELVGVAVPEFYAKVEPPELDPVRVRGRVKAKIWIAPTMAYTASARPIWIAAPSASWRARATFKPAPMRGGVAWYVRPPTLRAKLLVGGDLKGKYVTRLKVKAPEPRASLRARWAVPVGLKIKVKPPNLSAAADARTRVKLDMGGRLDVRGRARADVRPPAADIKVKVPEIKVKAPDVKVKVGGAVKAGGAAAGDVRGRADGAVKAGAGVKAGINVKPPEVKVKVKVPDVKVKATGSAGFKIGN